jgi:hypothetical protein
MPQLLKLSPDSDDFTSCNTMKPGEQLTVGRMLTLRGTFRLENWKWGGRHLRLPGNSVVVVVTMSIIYLFAMHCEIVIGAARDYNLSSFATILGDQESSRVKRFERHIIRRMSNLS